MNTCLEKAFRTDSTVKVMIQAGQPLEVIVSALVAQKQALLAKLVSIESICPRRYKDREGVEFVWHCPDEFIPVTELFPPTIPAEGLPQQKHENT